jgi:dihydroorotate dehydrogenase (fumarate)
MIDISTRYLGMNLKSPLVASASPLCESVDNLRRMEDAGIAAVVLPSLFEEQLQLESLTLDSDLSRGYESFAEAPSFLPDFQNYNSGPEGYLQVIHRAKKNVSIPVIASLNGVSQGGWVRYARLMQEAGADAIELNLYGLITDPKRSSSQVEQDYCELVSHVKASVTVPVAVKISQFFTAIPYVAQRLCEAGSDALILFNRFYQPDFDLETLDVVPNLSLSTSYELLLRIHWIAILYGALKSDLAVTGGVHSAEDVVKTIMAGANVAMMTSSLLRYGIQHAQLVLGQLERWMDSHEYESIRQMRGSMAYRSVPRPEVFERVNYMKVLSSYSLR